MKKLIWLRGNPATGQIGTDLTVSGTPPLTLTNSLGKPMKAWSVDVLPKQDLNGYDAPWPAGGGKNLLKNGIIPITTTSQLTFDLAQPVKAETYAISFQSTTATSWRYYIKAFDSNGDLLGDGILSGQGLNYRSEYHGYLSGVNTTATNITITVSTDCYLAFALILGDVSASTTVTDGQLELGSTATTYAPYANICPISGTDKLNLFVEESYDPTATPTAVIDVPLLSKNMLKPSSTPPPYGEWLQWGSGDLNKVLKAGHTYTFSVSGTNQNINLYFSNPYTYDPIVTGYGSVTYTPQVDEPYALDAYCEGGISADNLWQLEEGDTATAYEPYNATVYTATIGSEVGESRTAVYTFTGDEIWTKQNTYDKYYSSAPNSGYLVRDAKLPSDNSYSVPIKTSIGNFSYSYDSLQSHQYAMCIARDARFGINGDLYRAYNGNLAGIQVEYELATHVQFPITAPDIPTPKGTATAWATAEDGTVESMDVTYIGKA